MKIHAFFRMLLCAALLLCLTSCGISSEAPGTTSTTLPSTTMTTMAIIDEKLDDMLTASEISDAVGVTMGAPSISGQGTILTSIGVDSKAVLSVETIERPIAIFNTVLTAYPDLLPCPNLGESAWFSPVYNQLLVYGEGHMILVELTGTGDSDQTIQMLRCRQIAALLLEHL